MKLKTFDLLDSSPIQSKLPEEKRLGLFLGSVCPDFLIVGDMSYDEFAPEPFYNSHLSYLDQFLREENGPYSSYAKFSRVNVFDKYVAKGFYNDSLVSENVERLHQDISNLNPKLILFLGRDTFEAITGGPKQGRFFDDERGYPQWITIKDQRYLCIFSFHPRDIFAQPEYRVVVKNDCAKALRIYSKGWKLPSYNIKYWPSYYEVMDALETISKMDCLLSVDTETRGSNNETFITCVGIAWSETDAFVIPFHKDGLKPLFSPLEEAAIWKKLTPILEKKNLLGQNAVHYDSKVFFLYGVNANFTEDSMLLGWSCWQELPKSMGFLVSIYTDYDYHKDILSNARSGRVDFKQEFYYCGLDCCRTIKIYNELRKELLARSERAYGHYQFNIKFSRALEYCSRHGVPFKHQERDSRVALLEAEALDSQHQINRELGNDKFNVRSHKQVNQLLYEDWKLPPKLKVLEDVETGEDKVSIKSGYLEILYLSRRYPNLPLLLQIGKLRKLYHRISMLKAIGHVEGKCYWDFKVTGTETGRASGKKPMLNAGCQPQNADKRDRDLWYAPEGWDFYKADLEGADSWTQAAHLCAVGEEKLLEDLQGGVKPAQVLALCILENSDDVLFKTPQEIKALIGKHDWKGDKHVRSTYAVCKAISHGSAYMMRENTMSSNIFKQSDGELYIEPYDCALWQKKFFLRYNFPKLHSHMRSQLNSLGYSEGSSGLRRMFLGRRDDATLRVYLSSEPQANTGRATNETLLNIFSSPANMRPDGDLILHPVNQVHDEMDALGRVSDREHIHFKLFEPLSKITQEVYGTSFIIPFAEDRGSDWSNCKEIIWQ